MIPIELLLTVKFGLQLIIDFRDFMIAEFKEEQQKNKIKKSIFMNKKRKIHSSQSINMKFKFC